MLPARALKGLANGWRQPAEITHHFLFSNGQRLDNVILPNQSGGYQHLHLQQFKNLIKGGYG